MITKEETLKELETEKFWNDETQCDVYYADATEEVLTKLSESYESQLKEQQGRYELDIYYLEKQIEKLNK